MKDALIAAVREAGETVREALGSYQRTVRLAMILIAFGAAFGIYARVKGG